MMKKTIVAAALAVAFAAPAFANSCPTQVKAIDEALKTASLSDSQKQQVMSLRNEGQKLHDSGKHAESMAKLGEAKAIIGLK